jgi:hypothetical protein
MTALKQLKEGLTDGTEEEAPALARSRPTPGRPGE